jgi:hypothetical protein
MAKSNSSPPDPNIDYILLEEIVTNFEKFINEYFISQDSSSGMPNNIAPMIPGRYHEELVNAWLEITPKIQNLIQAIQGRSISLEDLDSVGLSGAQMRLKHKFCKEAYDSAKDWYTEEKMDESPKNKPWYKRWWSHCKRILGGSNIVVKSISKIFPIAEVISEFIDGVIFLGDLGTHSAD